MLDRIFRSDSPFWQTMGLLYDVAVVNILCLALSLPVVTAGAAITAAHDTARRTLEDRGESSIRMFMVSFRSNLKQGAVIGIVAIIALGATVTAWLLSSQSAGALPTAVLLTVVTVPTWTYVFAIQARFENPWYRTILVAFLLAFANLRWTLLALFVDAILIGLAAATLVTMPQAIPVVVIFGYGAIVFANTPILERALLPQLAAAEASEPSER